MATAIRDCSFVAFDLETTGLQAAVHHIVEIGAVRFDWQGNQKTFQTLVNPGRPIPDNVIRVHGITDNMVADKPLIHQVLSSFLQFIDGAILLAHNAPFDLGFLSCALQRLDYPQPSHLSLDTCRLARKLIPEAPNHKLETLAHFLKVPVKGAFHRALSDSFICQSVFQTCVNRLENKDSTEIERLIAKIPRARSAFYGCQQPDLSSEPIAQAIVQAITDRKDMRLVYQNAKRERTQRQITPIYLGGFNRHLYLEAYCHLRQEQRQFRLDRICEIALVTEMLVLP